MAFPPKRKRKIRYRKCKLCKQGVCKSCKGSAQIRIISGRNKGSSFERAIAKQVTDWTGVKFTRTPSSGGWAKSGDITPKNPEHMVQWPWLVECKNNESLDFGSIFSVPNNGKTPIRKWWKQAYRDVKKSGMKKIPVLVFTKSRDNVYCMMQADVFEQLKFRDTAQVVVHLPKHRVILWEDFLSIPYKEMLRRLQ